MAKERITESFDDLLPGKKVSDDINCVVPYAWYKSMKDDEERRANMEKAFEEKDKEVRDFVKDGIKRAPDHTQKAEYKRLGLELDESIFED